MSFLSTFKIFLLGTQLIVMMSSASTKGRPNVLYILIDDMGWNDVGYNGMTDIPTPNINALAYNGIILSNHYVYPVCSPSRASLMSSRFATSLGLQHLVLQPGQPLGLPLDLKILPQFLNDLGYESHMVGKPLFLYLAHHGVHRSNFFEPIRGPEQHVKLFTNLKNNSRRRNFAGALTAVDRSIGDIVEALEKKHMLKDTLIVFASDNGAGMRGSFTDNGASNYPLTGGKLHTWEGGIRVPAFIWSGRLKKRSFVYSGLMHVVDWLPTLYAAVAGGDRTKHIVRHHNLEGMSLWHAITEDRPSPRKRMLLQSDEIGPSNTKEGDTLHPLKAYRSGDYKILSGETIPQFKNDRGRKPPPPRVPTINCKTAVALRKTFGCSVRITGKPIRVKCGKPSGAKCDPIKKTCLFNIKKDPCELRNLAEKEPKILRRLEEEMRKIDVKDVIFPKVDYHSNPDFYSGYWVPWLDDPRCPDIKMTDEDARLSYCGHTQADMGSSVN